MIDGRRIADNILDELAQDKTRKGAIFILVGDDEGSKTFVSLKEKAIQEIGGTSRLVTFNNAVPESVLLSFIEDLNKDKNVNGILVQLPLPAHIDENKILAAIDPKKDIDGLTPQNLGNLVAGNKTILPATVKAILKIFDDLTMTDGTGTTTHGYDFTGKNVVIISRSQLIGKPLALALLQRDATVTICHSKTKNIEQFTRNADVIVTATGKPKFLTADMIKQGAIIIDAGYAVLGKRISGDTDISIRDKASYYTPVPGGVGPLTVAMVAENLVEAQRNQGSQERIRVVWLSANEFGYEMLKEAVKLPTLDVVGIITLSEDATTVMYDETESGHWYEFGVPVNRIRKINEEANLIRSFKPDLIVEAGWRQMISNEILNIPRLGTIGFHPTLLPHGRGPAPIINTILEGAKESGVTLYKLTDKVDAGPIIGQERFTIEDSDYASDVYAKVVDAGRKLVKRCFMMKPEYFGGTLQDETMATTFKKPKLEDNEILVPWRDDTTSDTPEMVMRKIRALSKPYKGAWIEFRNPPFTPKKLVIWKAELQ